MWILANAIFFSEPKVTLGKDTLYTKVSFKFCIIKVVWKASYVLDKDLFRNRRNTQYCPCSLFLYQSSIFCSILRSISSVKICTLPENACIWAAEITTSSKFKKKVWSLKILKCSVHIFRGPWLTYPWQGESFTKHLNEVCNEPKSMAKTKCHHNENRSPGKSRWSKSLYIVWCQNMSLHM